MNISPAEELTVLMNAKSENAKDLFNRYLPYIKRLARISIKDIRVGLSKPRMAATVLTPWAEIYIPMDEERIKKDIERLRKTFLKVEKDLEPVEKKFNDNNFVTKAPRDVVAKLETQRTELQEKRSKINAEIKRKQEMLS
jgi:valyl-tRNA synthetase